MCISTGNSDFIKHILNMAIKSNVSRMWNCCIDFCKTLDVIRAHNVDVHITKISQFQYIFVHFFYLDCFKLWKSKEFDVYLETGFGKIICAS